MKDYAQEIKNMKAQIAARPIRVPTRGNVLPIPAVYIILGNNILPACSVLGIRKRTDTVLAAEFPVPITSGIVPPWPIPTGLPLGVGVGRNLFDGSYSFLLLDSNASRVNYSLGAPQRVQAGGALSFISGPGTYICQVIFDRT